MRKERTKREGCGGRGGCKVWGNKGKKEKISGRKKLGVEKERRERKEWKKEMKE